MSRLSFPAPFLTLALTLALTPALSQPVGAQAPATPGVELKVVKYRDLTAAIRASAGKVVVVDVWGTFCPPCKREFPGLVELHRQHASKGLVCISVSVDPLEPGIEAKALTFLKQKGATFTNLLLDEKSGVWADKFGSGKVPQVFVFDRKGRRAALFGGESEADFTYKADIAPLVEKLLADR